MTHSVSIRFNLANYVKLTKGLSVTPRSIIYMLPFSRIVDFQILNLFLNRKYYA